MMLTNRCPRCYSETRHTLPGTRIFKCRSCYGDFDPSELVSIAPIITARLILRNDDGPTGELSEPEQYVQLGENEFYPLSQVRSVPAVLRGQLQIESEGEK